MKCAICGADATTKFTSVKFGWGVGFDEWEYRCNQHRATIENRPILSKSELKKRKR